MSFSKKVNQKPYTTIQAPPNITGKAHLGHVLNNTIQDILTRRARMQGKDTCWIPGLDHASIATEAKVVEMLKQQGIDKHTLGRQAFLQHAMAWKEKYGSIIVTQLKALGLSCNWEQMRFTLEPSIAQAVTKAFILLYEKGLIYKSKRMVHWDPKGQTALSDEEVIYKQVQGKLYYIQYQLVDKKGYVTVATTRPETLLGDVAICVHPEDKRYKTLQGQKAYIPLINRIVPIIADEYVEQKMGTGCLKITPAHDANDYNIAQRHNLPHLDILNPDGTLRPEAKRYVGEDRFLAREKIIKELKEKGYLIKTEPYIHQVGFSERTHVIVEPRLSTQWFVKMKNLAKPALKAVQEQTIQFHPTKFKNLYTHWMENIKDWCISRQLWWGHRIPVYYVQNGKHIVAHTQQEALEKARTLTGNQQLTTKDLKQENDVLDTWFSAWLWPIVVLDGIQQPNNPRFKQRYPTNDLITAPDIIFFWVARMIMAGYAFTGKPPFKNVYFTGLVRDEKRRKMSKSLGNSPDLMLLIKKYGADAVRVGVLFSAPAGNDLLFEQRLCHQGARFVRKISNAVSLIKSWKPTHQTPPPICKNAFRWLHARYQQILTQVNTCLDQFRLSEALILIYKLIWDDFCSHYLEMIKPLQNKSIPKSTHKATIYFLQELMKLLHPFMPFTTQKVWRQITPNHENEPIHLATWPTAQTVDHHQLEKAKHTFALINKIRQLKSQHSWPAQEPLTLHIQNEKPPWLITFEPYIKKATKLHDLQTVQKKQGTSFVIAGSTFSLPQITENHKSSTKEALEKEIKHLKSFLDKIHQKLTNKQFLQHAPEKLIFYEKKKYTDVQEKIKALQNLKKKPNTLT